MAKHKTVDAAKADSSSAPGLSELPRVKLVLTGPGNADGKVSRKLFGGVSKKKSGHGFNRYDASLDGHVIHIWDFTDQRAQTSFLPLFLTDRTVYLYVLHATTEIEDVDQWLGGLVAHGHPQTRVILVEEPPRGDPAIKEAIKALIKKHEEIPVEFHSGHDDTSSLKLAIARHADELSPTRSWNRSQVEAYEDFHRWLTAKTARQSRPLDPVASTEEFEEAVGADHAEELARTLHDLGLLVAYQEDSLLGYVIWDPNWLTPAVEYILTDHVTLEDKGELDRTRLDEIWRPNDGRHTRYALHYHPFLTEVMHERGLCLEIPFQRKCLFQALIPENPPAVMVTDQQRHMLSTRYSMKDVPANLMPIIIVATYGFSEKLHWRNGAYLKNRDSRAAIILDSNSLAVSVWGKTPVAFMNLLTGTLDPLLEQISRSRPSFQLERVGVELTSQLESGERLAHLGTEVAGLVHELRSPTAVTRGSVDVLLAAWRALVGLTNLIGHWGILDVLSPILEKIAESESTVQKPSYVVLELENEVESWLRTSGIQSPMKIAAEFVRRGVGVDWLEQVAQAIKQVNENIEPKHITAALSWLGYGLLARRAISEIGSNTGRIDHLVQAVGQYSKQNDERKTVDVNSSLDAALTIYFNKLKKNRINVVRDFGPSSTVGVHAHASKLMQIWVNVIGNAIDALSQRESDEDKTLRLKTIRDDRRVIVTIANNGPEIPPDMESQIFEPFVTTKSSSLGTGLGLYLVKRIVDEYDGGITVSSDARETAFEIALPASYQEPSTD